MKVKTMLAIIFSLNLATASASEMITVHVNGMVCSFCARGIEKKFSALAEIKDIKVDLTSKTVSLITHDNQTVQDLKIKTLMTEAGYHVTSIERK